MAIAKTKASISSKPDDLMGDSSLVPTTPKRSLSMGMVLLLIAAAFVVGMFWNRLQSLEQQVADLKGGKDVGGPTAAGTGSGNQGNPAAAAQAPQLGGVGEIDPVTKDDHLRGNPKADLVLIEYSDFECPFCKRFHPTMQQVLSEYGDKVAWVYRHFPLTQLHPFAQKSAEGAECVTELGGQDAFWEYSDAIMGVAQLNDQAITESAAKAGVDKNKFSSCLQSGKYTQKVSDQTASGQKAGVTGTPGTVILKVSTGQKQLIPGALPFEQVKQAIDALI